MNYSNLFEKEDRNFFAQAIAEILYMSEFAAAHIDAATTSTTEDATSRSQG
jgi:hypothetical protein